MLTLRIFKIRKINKYQIRIYKSPFTRGNMNTLNYDIKLETTEKAYVTYINMYSQSYVPH